MIALPLGWFAWRESKKEPVSDKKQEKLFTDVDADKVDQVTIKSEKGERTTVQKQGGKWQITAPVAVAADEGEVSGLTTQSCRRSKCSASSTSRPLTTSSTASIPPGWT